jgi:hypothetical protein
MSIQYFADRSNGSEEQPFLSENAVAMKKMMVDMTIKPTTDCRLRFHRNDGAAPPRGRSLPTRRPGRKAQT